MLCHNNLYLWNPSIRVVEELPENLDQNPWISFLCGLAFDSQISDSKVVQIAHKRIGACN